MSHPHPVPFQGPVVPGITIPAAMSIVAWLTDIKGNKLSNPTLSAGGLQTVRLWYTVENDSKLDATFAVHATVTVTQKTVNDEPYDPPNPDPAKPYSGPDFPPSNQQALELRYAPNIADQQYTLKAIVPPSPSLPKGLKYTQTAMAREISFDPNLASSWSGGAGPNTFKIALRFDVSIEKSKTSSATFTVVHQNLA